jgi:hypothetical protein
MFPTGLCRTTASIGILHLFRVNLSLQLNVRLTFHALSFGVNSDEIPPRFPSLQFLIGGPIRRVREGLALL